MVFGIVINISAWRHKRRFEFNKKKRWPSYVAGKAGNKNYTPPRVPAPGPFPVPYESTGAYLHKPLIRKMRRRTWRLAL